MVTSSGLSASTNSRAASSIAFLSPLGSASCGNFGMVSFVPGGIGPSCITVSTESSTGAIGGVIAIL